MLFLSSNRKRSTPRFLIGIFQLLMALYFTFNFLYCLRAFELLSVVYFFILPVILMFVPVFYLYILSITVSGFKLKSRHAIHFLPTLIIVLLNAPFLFTAQDDRISFVSHGYSMLKDHNVFRYLFFIYMVGILIIFTLQLVLYSLRAWKLYKKHKADIENRYSYTENINLDWIMSLILCFVIFFVFNDILYLIGFRQQEFIQIAYNISMLTTTLYIGYRGMLQIELHVSEQLVRPMLIASTPDTIPIVDIVPEIPEVAVEPVFIQANIEIGEDIGKNLQAQKYSGSSLTDEQKNALIEKLQELMNVEKIFINEKLSIEDVAVRLDSNVKYISQIINETYNQNFYNFINAHRIEEAKNLLVASGNERYSILGIAQSVGFVSKSAFNTAFKRFTGVTPTEFKSRVLMPAME